jgi:putative inorganic carbon (HCO3(-)) transporter
MRDIVMFGIVFAILPFILFHPWIGAIVWTWISLMNPHRLTWNAAFNFPFAAVVAGATLVGLVLTRDERRLPLTGPVLVLLAFVAWMCVTSVFAIYPDLIGDMFSKVMKIQLMIFVTLALLHTRKQIEVFLWVMALSIAFYGVKGGLFTFTGGGEYRVWGPAGTFIEGNNELALALIMVIPLLVYLRTLIRNPVLRGAMIGAAILVALAALGTQSRGALLAIAAMALLLWVRSRKKLLFGIGLIVVGTSLVAFMPQTWDIRMRTIETYEQDSSAMGRINAWWMAYRLAMDRPLGGGFEVTTPELFARYAPVPGDLHAAHSIYFQVLGEHGFVGLALFLLLWWTTWRSASWLSKNAGRHEDTQWIADLSRMLQVSLSGYFVGGAFLSLAYFDLPYDIMVVVVLCRRIVEMRLKTEVVPNPPVVGLDSAMVSKLSRSRPLSANRVLTEEHSSANWNTDARRSS